MRAGVAQNETVASRSRDRLLQHELHECLGARRDGTIAEQHHPRADFGGGMVQTHRHPLGDRPRLRCEHAQRHIDAVRRRVQVGIEHDLTARDGVLGDAVASEIERAAVAGAPHLRRPVLRMDGSHPRRQARGADPHLILGVNLPRQHRAGDHRASTLQGERAIHREPETPLVGAAAKPLGFGKQPLAQFIDALPGLARHRDHVGVAQRRGRQHIGDLGLHRRQTIGINQIGLGDGDEAMADPEQIDDRQMFHGLRHHAVVGGDHQQHEINATRAGEHVVHEALVARHIDKAKHAAIGRRQIGKAEVDGDAARLLILETVGVDAGQRPH